MIAVFQDYDIGGLRWMTTGGERLLLHCGVDWHDAPTALIRGRAPRSAA